MMPEGLYSKRLQAFQYALIGRLFLPKGASSRPLPDLKSELSKILKPTEDWRLVPLGKGFFSLKFANQDDQYRASRSTSWKLACGSFHIREWKPDFDPYNAQTSMTQVWVRLFHLPEEYWDPDFLVGIFRAVGNVIKLDGHTAAGMVGHFARALVEIDLSLPITESIMIGRSSTSFQVNFGYENLPFFCTFCKFIGHSVSTCNHAKRKDAANDQKKADPPTRADKVKEKWVEKSKMPDSEFHANNVPTSNTFAVLQEEAPHFEDNSNDLQADESPPRSGPDLLAMVSVPVNEEGNPISAMNPLSAEDLAAVDRAKKKGSGI